MSQVSEILQIRADVNELVRLRQFIRNHAQRAGANSRTTNDMVQAVDEVVTNSIVHGYRGAEGIIEVEVDIVDRSLVVRLRDGARPFDPTSVPAVATSLPLSQRTPGGMGIHLCREMTDEMSYQRIDGHNEVKLVKHFRNEGGESC